MLRHALALAATLVLAAALPAEILDVPCPLPDPLLPEGWAVRIHDLTWGSSGVYLRLDVRGNCRMETETVCYPAPGGGEVCRDIEREVCDDAVKHFPFGDALTIVNRKWVYHVRQEGAPVVFGEAFDTAIPYRAIVLWRGAKLHFDEEEGAFLRLDTEQLGQDKRRAFFRALHR